MGLDSKHKNRKLFEKFLELYNEGHVKMIFYKSGYSVGINQDELNKIENVDEFNKFCGEFMTALKVVILDDEEHEYDEFVNEFLKENDDIKGEIVTKVTTNVNSIVSVENEILTKRNNTLKVVALSSILNINYRKPVNGQDNVKQINFELSIKDLKELRDKVDDIITNIEKLEKEEVEKVE